MTAGIDPALACTARVVLPPKVVVCPCGRHHMVRGQRIRQSYCELLWRTS